MAPAWVLIAPATLRPCPPLSVTTSTPLPVSFNGSLILVFASKVDFVSVLRLAPTRTLLPAGMDDGFSGSAMGFDDCQSADLSQWGAHCTPDKSTRHQKGWGFGAKFRSKVFGSINFVSALQDSAK